MKGDFRNLGASEWFRPSQREDGEKCANLGGVAELLKNSGRWDKVCQFGVGQIGRVGYVAGGIHFSDS